MTGRILVALDHSHPSRAALREAVRLAEALGAELAGLYVEDAELFSWAMLPFGREVVAATGGQRRLSPAGLARSFEVQAEQIRDEMKQALESHDIPWTFHVIRGRVPTVIEEISRDSDVLMMGAFGRNPLQRMGKTAGRMVDHGSGPVWLVPDKTRNGHSVLVPFDGSQAAERTLQAASALPLTRDTPVTVIIKRGADEEALTEQAQTLLDSGGRSAHILLVNRVDAHSLAHTARTESGRALLIAAGSPLLEESALEDLLRNSECPVVVIR